MLIYPRHPSLGDYWDNSPGRVASLAADLSDPDTGSDPARAYRVVGARSRIGEVPHIPRGYVVLKNS